jgi:hypothetical protein
MNEGIFDQLGGAIRPDENVTNFAAVRQQRALEGKLPGSKPLGPDGEKGVVIPLRKTQPEGESFTQTRTGIRKNAKAHSRPLTAPERSTPTVRSLEEAKKLKELQWEGQLQKELGFSLFKRNITPDEWERLAKIDPFAAECIKHRIRTDALEDRVRKAVGGDEELFATLWQEEMNKLNAEGRKRRAAEEVSRRKLPPEGESRAALTAKLTEVGQSPLTTRQWQERERMRGRNPAELTMEEWQAWQASPASVSLTGLEELKDSLADRHARREAERQKRLAYGWENDPADLSNPYYIEVVFEEAEKLGVNPHKLTPRQRLGLARFEHRITKEQRKQLAQFDAMRPGQPLSFLQFFAKWYRLIRETNSRIQAEQDFLAYQEQFSKSALSRFPGK